MNKKLVVSLLVLYLAFFIGFANAQRCQPITFSNVTPGTFECMKSKLQNYGVNVPPGDYGELSARGVSADFLWDGESLLTVGVKELPFFVRCERASNELSNFVGGCQGS
jgi:hypothetical protein